MVLGDGRLSLAPMLSRQELESVRLHFALLDCGPLWRPRLVGRACQLASQARPTSTACSRPDLVKHALPSLRRLSFILLCTRSRFMHRASQRQAEKRPPPQRGGGFSIGQAITNSTLSALRDLPTLGSLPRNSDYDGRIWVRRI